MGRLADNPYSGLRFPTGNYISGGTRTSVALNSAFVYNVSGAAVAVRYQARSADPISDIYVLVDTVAGTLANVVLGCELRNEAAGSITQPGTTVRATATNTGVAAVPPKWVRFNFTSPYTPTIGEVLWFLVKNVSAAPTVDIPSILGSFNAAPGYSSLQGNQTTFSSASSGFGSGGTTQARSPFVVVQGGKSYGFAVSINNAAVYPSDTSLRGFQIKPPVDLEVCGWQTVTGNVNLVNVRIYDAATPPAGTPLYTLALGTQANQSRDELIGAKYFPPIILNAGITYNVVTSWAVASTVGGGTIEDYASFPAVFDDLVDGFVNCWPVSDVGGTWTLLKSGYLNQQLIVSGLLPGGSRASYALGI
jgi:hypothetical protein